jgi:hypothetical protein
MTSATTICDAFAATVAAHADQPALRTPDGGIDWTSREYAERSSRPHARSPESGCDPKAWQAQGGKAAISARPATAAMQLRQTRRTIASSLALPRQSDDWGLHVAGVNSWIASPQAGKHYPHSLGDFQAWFRTDADCLDYLDWLRWREGFVCPECGQRRVCELGDGRYECSECHERVSPTAGTILDKMRTPLTVWFTAFWLFASQKDGISALALKRALEIGSYQTAWAMLHRLRSVLVRPGRELLQGEVEVDEPYIGGEEPGLRGGRQKGKKVLVAVAAERREPKGFGRCRMVPIPDASGRGASQLLASTLVEAGATPME